MAFVWFRLAASLLATTPRTQVKRLCADDGTCRRLRHLAQLVASSSFTAAGEREALRSRVLGSWPDAGVNALTLAA